MNKKMQGIRMMLKQYLVNEYAEEYLKEVFRGKITIDEFLNQIILEYIKYAYDYTREQHSIRYYLKQSGIDTDDQRKRYERTNEYVKKHKKIEIERLRAIGIYVEHNIEEKDSLEKKLEGYHISEMDFYEQTNIMELELIKAIVNNRLMYAKKIPNNEFERIAMQYDKFITDLFEHNNDSDEKMVFNSLAYFNLEWKYAFDFYYHCIEEAEKNNIGVEEIVQKSWMLFGDRQYISEYGYKIFTDSRMVGYREGLISEFVLNPVMREQYGEMLTILVDFKEVYKVKGILIKEWFRENTNVEDWASFLKEYNVFKAAKMDKEWNRDRIRNMRKIYQMVIYPLNQNIKKNSEEKNRYDSFDIEISSYDCYLEEYVNEKGMKSIRLREKRTNKKVILIENSAFLLIANVARKSPELFPGIFERDGEDLLLVIGFVYEENDEEIELSYPQIILKENYETLDF